VAGYVGESQIQVVLLAAKANPALPVSYTVLRGDSQRSREAGAGNEGKCNRVGGICHRRSCVVLDHYLHGRRDDGSRECF
jgi:hypothetical protein